MWVAALLLAVAPPGAPAAAAGSPDAPGQARSPGSYLVGFVEVPSDVEPGGLLWGQPVREVDVTLAVALLDVVEPEVFNSGIRVDSRVAYVEQDRRDVRALLQPDDPRWVEQYGPLRVRAPEAWDVTLGSTAAKVAVLDTGLRKTHEEFVGGRVLQGRDVANGDNDPTDDHGHGTHVTGIALANTGNRRGIAGLSQSTILPVKVLDENGGGTFSDVATGIRWAADQGAHAISMSLGTATNSATVRRAVEYAWSKGALLVAAAGNDGACGGCVLYPARYKEVIAVACTDANDARCWFSSQGPEVELAAPGYQILSTAHAGDAAYLTKSGTSMSTPHVSGVAALAKTLRPGLDNQQLRLRLRDAARDLGSPGMDASFGYGLADAAAALSSPAQRPQTPPAGLTAAPGPFRVTLTWQPPAGERFIEAYRIYRGSSPGQETFLAETKAVLNRDYTDGNLPSGTTWYYLVTAVNELGEGPASVEVSATTPTPPGPPENLQAAPGPCFGSVTLTWEAPVDDGGWSLDGYRIYRADELGGPKMFAGEVLASHQSFEDRNVPPGARWTYYVSAFHGVGEGPHSAPSESAASSVLVPCHAEGVFLSAEDVPLPNAINVVCIIDSVWYDLTHAGEDCPTSPL